MTEHIVAVFPDSGTADAAERDLRSLGIPDAAIRRYASDAGRTSGREPMRATPQHQQVETEQPSGFWAWLLGEETTSTTTTADYGQESQLFEQRAAGGDTVLSVTVADDSKIHEAIEVLDAHSPIEIDERTDDTVDD